MANQKDVLVAIDGSGSKEWREKDGSNSHVFRFFDDFQTSHDLKKYYHGPTTMGFDTEDILDGALVWMQNTLSIRENWREARTPMNTFDYLASTKTPWGEVQYKPSVNATGHRTSVPTIVGPKKPMPRVSIVGHSRGGVIGIELARRLARYALPVYFLGLYDAVDRSLVHSRSITNVERTFHARRGLATSRWYFGNTGLGSSGDYLEEFFETSHGGVGGSSAAKSPNADLLDDESCVQRETLDLPSHPEMLVLSSTYEISPGCKRESVRADRWIRRNARQCELPIPKLDHGLPGRKAMAI